MDWLAHGEIVLRPEERKRHEPPDLETVVRICLTTGARRFEAENLKKISPRNTKSHTPTRKAEKTAPPQSAKSSMSLCLMMLSSDFYDAFRSALERTGIELLTEQLTHVLHHIFTNHFMMNGGNILVLQRMLGHKDREMIMQHAHFLPDHLEDSLYYNPLENKLG